MFLHFSLNYGFFKFKQSTKILYCLNDKYPVHWCLLLYYDLQLWVIEHRFRVLPQHEHLVMPDRVHPPPEGAAPEEQLLRLPDFPDARTQVEKYTITTY